MTHPPAAPIGSNSGSYDPDRRSASATRKIDTEAAERAGPCRPNN
jgi:hypothetical protein